MSTFSIPNNLKQIRQANRGEVFGEIIESFNIDLNSNLGKILVAKKLEKILDETDNLNTGDPQAFEVYDGDYVLLTTAGVYQCDATLDPTTQGWTKIGGIDDTAVSAISDIVTFGSLLLVSRSTNILSWNGSTDDDDWWTTVSKGGETGSALTTGRPHIMHVHRGGQETLFVTDDNKVLYANNTAGHSTVTLQADMVACCISSGVSATWVGTYTESGTNAYVYEIYVGEEIDSVPVARNAYKVEGRAVLSINVIDNVPYIITEKGNLQAFNGVGFTTVASLPFAYSDEELNNVRLGNVEAENYERPVHPKGMVQHNRSLLININTELASDDYAARAPSGVWEYNIDTGTLNHRYAFSEASTDYGTRTLSRSGALFLSDTDDTLIFAIAENSTSGLLGVYMETDNTNLGYFVTKEIESDSVTDAYESIYAKAKTLGASDKIEIKWRIEKQDRQLFNGAFMTSTQINTTDDVTVAVGDEITITEGSDSGKIAHVTEFTDNGTTISIVLDTAIGTAGQSVRAELNNFKPISYDWESGTYNPNNLAPYLTADKEVKRWGGFPNSPWIQFKVVMTGPVELRQFLVKSNSKNEL